MIIYVQTFVNKRFYRLSLELGPQSPLTPNSGSSPQNQTLFKSNVSGESHVDENTPETYKLTSRLQRPTRVTQWQQVLWNNLCSFWEHSRKSNFHSSLAEFRLMGVGAKLLTIIYSTINSKRSVHIFYRLCIRGWWIPFSRTSLNLDFHCYGKSQGQALSLSPALSANFSNCCFYSFEQKPNQFATHLIQFP